MKHPISHKIIAVLTAAFLLGSNAVPALAVTDGIAISIDQITLTMDELAEMDYVVPVYVSISENSGFNVSEFGVEVDERCTCTSDIKWLDYDDGFAVTNENLTWRTIAGADIWTETGSVLLLNVTIPEDAQPGDIYEISYVPEDTRTHIWQNLFDGRNYVDTAAVEWTDGYIKIADDSIPEPTEKYFTEGRDDWSFLNSYTSFGASGYVITDAHYAALVDGLSNKEKEKIDDLLNGPWKGSCYGMAATSVLAFHDILQPAEWQENAVYLHDISNPPNDEVKSLIHYYYALQKTDAVQQTIADAVYNSTEEEKLRRLISCLSDDSPTLLTYLDYNWGGHAVVAYDIVYGFYALNGSTYNGKVLIYDSNNTTLNESCCLYFNSQNWSWCIPGYNLSSENNSYLGIISDDVDAINYRGLLDGTDAISAEEYITILNSAPLTTDFTITKTEAAVPDANLNISAGDGIKAYCAQMGGSQQNEVSFALPDADSGYTMELAETDALSLSMDYADSLLKLDASAASKAVFDPSGYIGLSGEQSAYTMEMVSNETDGSWYRFTIEGSSTDSAALQRTAEGCILKSDNLSMVSVSTHGDNADALVGFSTDYDSVLLYEIDAETIGAAADTDGDGSYETCIASSDTLVMGDTTLDGALSVLDVITLNRALLGGNLNTAQAHNADANGDGTPTAMDSLNIWKTMLGLS